MGDLLSTLWTYTVWVAFLFMAPLWVAIWWERHWLLGLSQVIVIIWFLGSHALTEFRRDRRENATRDAR